MCWSKCTEGGEKGGGKRGGKGWHDGRRKGLLVQVGAGEGRVANDKKNVQYCTVYDNLEGNMTGSSSAIRSMTWTAAARSVPLHAALC